MGKIKKFNSDTFFRYDYFNDYCSVNFILFRKTKKVQIGN